MKDERGGEMEQQGILKNKAYLYLTDTICSVFENVYTVDVEGSTNRELFASDAPDLPGTLLANAEELEDVELKSMMDTVGGKLTACEGRDMILTDDKAPVEVLGMRVIDSIIQEEIGYYKEIFKKEGLKGLLGRV